MKILHKIFVIILAFIAFGGTFFLEQTALSSSQIVEEPLYPVVLEADGQKVNLFHDNNVKLIPSANLIEFVPGDTLETLDSEETYLVIRHNSIIRLAPQTSLAFLLDDKEKNGFLFKLLKGRAWVYNALSDSTLNILAGGSYIIPEQSVVDIEYVDDKTKIYALEQNANVGLIALNYAPESITSSGHDDFMNSFLLSQGNQVTIPDAKLEKNAEIVQKLFYSKLIKEFQYGFFDPGIFQKDSWFIRNLEADKLFFQERANFYLKKIRDSGLKTSVVHNQVTDIVDSIIHTFTLSEDKRISRDIHEAFDHFDDARYLTLFGRSSDAENHLQHFRQFRQIALDDLHRSFFIKNLENRLAELAFVTPAEPLYFSKRTVLDELLIMLGSNDEDLQKKFELAHQYLHYAYGTATTNPQIARLNLEDYFNHVSALLQANKNHLAIFREHLGEDLRNLDNLFLQYPAFYRDSFFASKYQLEQQWLALLPEGAEKLEESQTIISNKIEILRRLKNFFLADQIDLESARQIVFRLFRETEDLQLPASAQLAINDLFTQRLNDYGIFFRYLNSPEYSSTNLHGSSHRMRYEQFLKDQEEQISINELRKEILGDNGTTTESPTIEQISQKIIDDLEASGITQVQLDQNVRSSDQKIVTIQRATLKNYTFKAEYDWDKKLLAKIYVGDTLISNDWVQPANVELLLQSRLGIKPGPKPKLKSQDAAATSTSSGAETQSEQPVTQTSTSKTTERVAKILLIKKLSTLGILAKEENIVVKDLAAKEFAISQVALAANLEVTFSFVLTGDEQAVSKLAVVSDTGEVKSDKVLSLENVLEEVQRLMSQG